MKFLEEAVRAVVEVEIHIGGAFRKNAKDFFGMNCSPRPALLQELPHSHQAFQHDLFIWPADVRYQRSEQALPNVRIRMLSAFLPSF